MSHRFHVTSSANRASIEEFGLDWKRMGPARGIAGSNRPEAEGCCLAEEHDVEWFVQMNNSGGPVDVWAVDGVDEDALLDNGNGYFYLPQVIPPASLTLVRTDLPPREWPPAHVKSAGQLAYRSQLTIRYTGPAGEDTESDQ